MDSSWIPFSRQEAILDPKTGSQKFVSPPMKHTINKSLSEKNFTTTLEHNRSLFPGLCGISFRSSSKPTMIRPVYSSAKFYKQGQGQIFGVYFGLSWSSKKDKHHNTLSRTSMIKSHYVCHIQNLITFLPYLRQLNRCMFDLSNISFINVLPRLI
jgi:hypothetical protein